MRNAGEHIIPTCASSGHCRSAAAHRDSAGRGHRGPRAFAWAVIFLLAVTSGPLALADGGAGAGCFFFQPGFQAGGSGGRGFSGNPGSPGDACSGGGGGGAGGGTGGNGGGIGGAGGAGGTSSTPNGQHGGNAASLLVGGGGGGGGYNGNGFGSATINNGSILVGGNGGNGGNGGFGPFGGGAGAGGGGAGGYGAVVTGAATASVNTAGISGGRGGDEVGGEGGAGGIGVAFAANGAKFTNLGTIIGGPGGNGGFGPFGPFGTGGPGGEGVSFTASGATFTNSGRVIGGNGGFGFVGGAGGAGVSFTGSGATFTNSGIVNGGGGGGGGSFFIFGRDGAGGAGVSFTASGATFINSGTVNGGIGDSNSRSVGGGGGAGVSFTASGATFTNSGTVNGGLGGVFGGAGVSFTASGATFTNSGTVNGGTGGLGGEGVSFAASGATFTNSGTVNGGTGGFLGGGAGVSFTASGATFINSGTVNGGPGGNDTGGGAGIMGTGLTIINSGTVTGNVRAPAIVFTGGTNVLELQSGSTITGSAVAFSTADMLRLGGASDASFDITQIGNQYQGFGLFQKTGSSAWTLTGTNATVMPWAINGGTLQADAAMASSIIAVNSGGKLAGTGIVGPATVNSGGTLAPGSAGTPGTMTILGNLSFHPGAFYIVRVDPSIASNANVTGTAALAGTVGAAFAPASSVTRSYTILHTAGLGGTTFDALQTTGLPTGFDASLNYTTTDAILDLTAALGALEAGGLSGNQQRVASALNNFFNSGGALPPNFIAIFGLSGENLSSALTQLSGEARTGAQQGAFQLMTEFLTLMLDPFVDGRSGTAMGFTPSSEQWSFELASADPASVPTSAPFPLGWTVWGGAYGGVNHTDGDAAVTGSHDLRASTVGFAVGADYRLSPSTALGFALAGGGTGWSLTQGLGGGNSDAFQAGIYGKTAFGPAYVAAAFAYTHHWMSTERSSFVSGSPAPREWRIDLVTRRQDRLS